MTLIRSGWCESVKIKFLSAGFTISSEVHDVTRSACERVCECAWQGGCLFSMQNNSGSEALQARMSTKVWNRSLLLVSSALECASGLFLFGLEFKVSR